MILDEIVAYKREFVAHAKKQRPLADIRSRIAEMGSAPEMRAAISRHPGEDLRVIAEVKKASPSKGIIREDFDPVRIAAQYAEAGAAAISVLTDEEFFKGHLDYLRRIRGEIAEIPLLRKDFTIDEYQIYEAREAGASCILLIAGILDKHRLADYRELAHELGMEAITEVHLEREADVAAEMGARIIGINNRDLRDFTVDLEQTSRIIRLLGGATGEFTFIAESGIRTPEDVDYMRQLGVDALLVGESLMREKNPGDALKRLMERTD